MSERFATIVVGSGSAGLYVALEARAAGPVLVITKGTAGESNTSWAQGGIAAAIGPADSPAQHLADTIEAGAGLVDEAAARILCDEAPGRIRDLLRYGVPFDRRNDHAVDEGELALGREAAHSRSRIVHAGGDRTGAGIASALLADVRAAGIEVRERTDVARLVLSGGRVVGVETVDAGTGRQETIEAANVVLATGGAGQLFSHTTNPPVATGDGVALAFEAGAELMDLEFFQFHPTALRLGGVRPFLISEAVRGEGAVLLNGAGERFMVARHPLLELAPRDIVARAIRDEMAREGTDHVVLDCTGLAGVDLETRFPGVFGFCLEAGLDIRRKPIPIAPAAHYFMGGVRTDTWGRTTVPGLFACGEAACTGVHGANRLASNSLMETVVFGKRVADALNAEAHRVKHEALPSSIEAATVTREMGPGGALGVLELRRLMWDAAGIVRKGEEMRAAIERIERGDGRPSPEGRRMNLVASLMLKAALSREESRGAHYRADYPGRDDEHWQRHHVVVRGD